MVLVEVLHQVCIAKNAIGILGCNYTLYLSPLLVSFIIHYSESVGVMGEVNNLDIYGKTRVCKNRTHIINKKKLEIVVTE